MSQLLYSSVEILPSISGSLAVWFRQFKS